MSCPHEWQISAYVDAGLGAADGRALEGHLVGCARCRRRVIALRDEARVLRDLAHERLPAPLAPAQAARGLALGLPIAIGVLALGSLGAGAALEALPRPLLWLAPNEPIGVPGMLVDLFFAVRKNFAGWFDFASALAVLGAVAGVAYLAADLLLRRARGGARAAAALVALGATVGLDPAPAHAKFEVRDREDVVVAPGETIEASLVAMGDSVTIEGTVRGDLLAFGETVRIRGAIEGNVFCAGEEVELAGSVRGSVHCAGRKVRAALTTQGSVYAAGEEVSLEPAARIGGDLAVACSECTLNGEVARDLFAAGESLTLEGRAGRDVSLHATRVSFRATASYPGAIDLHLPEGESPGIAEGAALGAIARSVMDGEHGPAAPLRRFTQAHRIKSHVVTVFAAFLVGLVLYALTPGLFDTRVESLGRFFGAVGVGFAALIVLPVALVLLAISVLGIPLAVLGVLFLATLAFVGPIVVAAVVGRIVTRSEGTSFREFAVALGVGTLLLGVLTGIPGIGAVALWILVLEGVGLLTLDAFEWWRARRAPRLDDADAGA
jgi:anti-sigma factor RsiW